jgi:hypothetical protein
MVNKALVLENHRGVMERKSKLVHQHQSGSSSRPRVATSTVGLVFHPAQPQFQPRLQAVGQEFSTSQCQVNQHPKNFQTPATRNQNVQKTQVAQDPTKAECKCYACGEKGHHANRCPNLRPRPNHPSTTTPAQPVEPTLFLLLLGRTMLMGESTTLLWRKLQTWSLVCFSSTTLLHLCCLILEHRIVSYLPHMLKSIICP